MTPPRPTPSPNPGPANLGAPWRLSYLESLAGEQTQTPAGFLRAYWESPDDDEQNHVVHRNAHGMILLNAFPYANGHLLVALGEARARLLEYEPAQRARLWELVGLATDLLERTLQPQGVNIGVNQGVAAGAGVPGHLHVHLVPRWGGDTNFMTAIADVRVIPASLEAMSERYRQTLRDMA